MRYSEPSPITASVSTLVNDQRRAGPRRLAAPRSAERDPAAKSTATTMPATASTNRTTRRDEVRRAAAWCSKKFMPAIGGSRLRTVRLSPIRTAPSAPRAPRLLLGRISSSAAGAKLNMPAKMLRREHFAPVVVGHHRVVERLARERDLVLGRGQLLGELHHVLVGLEVRIGLGHRHQSAQRAVQHALRRWRARPSRRGRRGWPSRRTGRPSRRCARRSPPRASRARAPCSPSRSRRGSGSGRSGAAAARRSARRRS